MNQVKNGQRYEKDMFPQRNRQNRQKFRFSPADWTAKRDLESVGMHQGGSGGLNICGVIILDNTCNGITTLSCNLQGKCIITL